MTIFEKIYQDPIQKSRFLYDDGVFFAMLDAHPISPGHTLIIPVEPIVSLFELDDKQILQLRNAIKSTKSMLESRDLKKDYEQIIQFNISSKSVQFCAQAIEALLSNNSIDGYNTGNNEGRTAGRTVDHLHIHLIPRYQGDMENPEGGIRHIIPGKGYYR